MRVSVSSDDPLEAKDPCGTAFLCTRGKVMLPVFGFGNHMLSSSLLPIYALSFWLMKRRAEQVGERLRREVLAPAFTALDTRRMKRSGLPPGCWPSGWVAGPIVALRPDHDRALGTRPRGTLGDQVDRVTLNRGRLRHVRAVVARSAMGAVSVRGVGAPELDLVDAQKMRVLRRVVTIAGSRVVTRNEWLIGDVGAAAAGLLRRPPLARVAAGFASSQLEEAPHARGAHRETRRPPPAAVEGVAHRGPRGPVAHAGVSRCRQPRLEGELLSDLAEMERVGSSPGVVEVHAQIDRSPGQDASKGTGTARGDTT